MIQKCIFLSNKQSINKNFTKYKIIDKKKNNRQVGIIFEKNLNFSTAMAQNNETIERHLTIYVPQIRLFWDKFYRKMYLQPFHLPGFLINYLYSHYGQSISFSKWCNLNNRIFNFFNNFDKSILSQNGRLFSK